MRNLNELGLHPFIHNPDIPRQGRAEHVSRFEAHFGLRLPADYVRFLEFCNGGFADAMYFIPAGATADQEWDLNDFYFLDPDGPPESNLWHATEQWRSYLGTSACPFARTGGGDQVYLDLSNGGERVLLFLNDEPEDAVRPVADSFASFLDLLHAESRGD